MLSSLSSRRVVLGLIIAAVAPAFALTQFVVNRYREERTALAAEWSARGDNDLPVRPATAVTDFQTALSYEERDSDQFRLAKALVAADRPAEANAQLLSLVSDEPSRGDLNLELARLAARRSDVDEAVRYYHAAIDGTWPTGAPAARREARTELARFLMSRGQQLRAQAELIGVIDDLPPDAALITNVASLLVEAGAQARALAVVRRALALDPHNARASELAGTLEFNTGDFRAASRDFLNAATSAPLSSDSRNRLDIAERALELDPYLDRLAVRARAGRVLNALAIAKMRLERCSPMPALADRVDGTVKRRAIDLERDVDLIDDTMDVVFDIERLPEGSCGTDSADDRALALIASQHPVHSQ